MHPAVVGFSISSKLKTSVCGRNIDLTNGKNGNVILFVLCLFISIYTYLIFFFLETVKLEEEDEFIDINVEEDENDRNMKIKMNHLEAMKMKSMDKKVEAYKNFVNENIQDILDII